MWVEKQFSFILKPANILPAYSVSLVIIYVKQIFDLLILFLDCIYHAKLSVSIFFAKVRVNYFRKHELQKGSESSLS